MVRLRSGEGQISSQFSDRSLTLALVDSKVLSMYCNFLKAKDWTEGYVTVGAGQTWGQNFWWKLENAEGVYDVAWKNGKEVVGGNCHSVGVVGWTLGGGRGWLAAKHGAGVDQVLSMDVVLADGTILTDIRHTNSYAKYPCKYLSHHFEFFEACFVLDLFSALRGGGGGFAVVTQMKLKLHDVSLIKVSTLLNYKSIIIPRCIAMKGASIIATHPIILTGMEHLKRTHHQQGCSK